MRRALALVLAPWLTAAALRAAPPGDELDRYGFAREYLRRHDGGAPTASQMPVDAIPAPRPPTLPSTGPTIPPPAGRVPPLILQPLPGGRTPPTGASPSLPAPRTDRATYVGDAACLACHRAQREDPERSHLALSRHAAALSPEQRGCEGCHGPGSRHADGDPRFIVNPARQGPEFASRTCLACHRATAAPLAGAGRGGPVDPHQWFTSRHASARLSCTSCHKIHGGVTPGLLAAPRDASCLACHSRVAAELRLRSHHPVRAEGFSPLKTLSRGKVSCLDCHDAHGGADPQGMLLASLEDTCARCHPGHTGPFVFPHLPEGRREGSCLACHRPHGSPHRDLLKATGRGTCARCHTDLVTHFPAQGCASQGCHRDVHGSNKSPLFFR